MKARLKKFLRQLKRDPAGKRFKNAHQRAGRLGVAAGWARALCVVGALACVVIGVVLVFIPGPAFVFFILAGALIATQSWWAARQMDKAEVKTWAFWAWLKRKWRTART